MEMPHRLIPQKTFLDHEPIQRILQTLKSRFA